MGELNNTLIIFLSDNGGCHEVIKNQGNYIRTTGETGTINSFDSYEFPWANVSNTPFRMYKHWVHEGGISTPFIAFYPKMIKGGRLVTETVGHITDLMPTFLDFAGGVYPKNFKGNNITPMEGISLRSAFSGKKLDRNKPLFWEHEGNRAIRKGDWKLVAPYDSESKKFMPWELYNLKADRSELHDVILENPEMKNQLIKEYDQWADRVGVMAR
jgi:arylsulfatase